MMQPPLPPPPTNKITTQLGGRTFAAHVKIVDDKATTDAVQLAFEQQLQEYQTTSIPMESTIGITTRERVLERMTGVCCDWVQSVAGAADSSRCHFLTSGSYRLGVHEPGADIDTIVVAPNVCQRSDFFGTVSDSDIRDPSSLAERIRNHPDVTNFVPVEGAAVPLLTFDWEGINIDLLFARLATHTVPVDFDVNNDSVLDGVDSATEKSLNGPRVTNLIAEFCSGTPQRYATFLATVRCVRKWAKAKGLYSNKMGYWVCDKQMQSCRLPRALLSSSVISPLVSH